MRVRHARVELHLRALSTGPGPGLLLLHELGGSADDWPEEARAWPGAVHALDLSGHARSGRLSGGAYSPELLAGDADAALRELGPCCLAGRGVGAYVALLLAGGRPEHVPAALLCAGRGLAGGGAKPDFDRLPAEPHPAEETPRSGQAQGGAKPGATDPAALHWLAHDLRPVDYAGDFARGARALLLLEDGAPRPPWWEAVRSVPSAKTLRGRLPHEALAALARAAADAEEIA